EGRTTHRNGHRTKMVSTPAGDIEARIPKLRSGSFFPALLERRRRVDRALYAVIMQAYPTWLNLVRKVGGVESVDQVGDLGGYRGGGVDGLPGDGQLEGAVALEGPDQALDGYTGALLQQ